MARLTKQQKDEVVHNWTYLSCMMRWGHWKPSLKDRPVIAVNSLERHILSRTNTEPKSNRHGFNQKNGPQQHWLDGGQCMSVFELARNVSEMEDPAWGAYREFVFLNTNKERIAPGPLSRQAFWGIPSRIGRRLEQLQKLGNAR